MRAAVCALIGVVATTGAVPAQMRNVEPAAMPGTAIHDRAPPQADYPGQFHHGRLHHGKEYLNAGAVIRATGTLYLSADGSRFVILVEPNLVGHAEARRVADRLSVGFCDRGLSPVRVTYDRVERRARERLSAWHFGGRCG